MRELPFMTTRGFIESTTRVMGVGLYVDANHPKFFGMNPRSQGVVAIGTVPSES